MSITAFIMEAGASPATPAFLLSPFTSLSTVVRRHCSGRVSVLPDHTSSPSALRKNFPSSPCCRASMSTGTRTSGTEIKESYPEEFNDSREFGIMSLSPLDGRYAPKIRNLRPFFSKYGLIHYRIMVEIQWLIKLSEISEVEEVSELSEDARSFLKSIVDNFSIKDALEVKEKVKKTNHDVKAVEYFLKQRCGSCPEVAKITKSTEVGSSTMLHRVNPINFVNSEGNLCLTNAVLSELAMKLPFCACRDLSHSIVSKSIGGNSETTCYVKMRHPRALRKAQGFQQRKGCHEGEHKRVIKRLDLPEKAQLDLLDPTPTSYTG